MKRVIVGVAAVGYSWMLIQVAQPAGAQFSPEPTPSTTIPDGAVGTCQIEGISPAYDDTLDAIVGVDMFLRCAETTERTTLHQLHIAGVNADALQNLLQLVVPATSQPVTPQ